MAKQTGRLTTGAPAPELESAAVPRPPAVEAAEDQVLVSTPAGGVTLPRFLRKFTEVGLLASFLGAVLAYQLSLPEGAQRFLYSVIVKLNGGDLPTQGGKPVAIFVKDFMPFLQASVPVLEVKTTVWLMTALIFIAVHFSGRLYETFFKVPVFPTDLATRKNKRDWYRLLPFLCIVGFLLWSIFSFSSFGWGPAVPSEALEFVQGDKLQYERAATTGVVDQLAAFWGKALGVLVSNRGGSYHSLVAWVQVAIALLFFLVAEDVIRTRRLVYKILGLILALGVIASIFSILVHARTPFLKEVWIQWAPGDYRNDVGGFIGHNTAVSSFVIAPFLLAFTLLMAHRYRTATWVRGLLVGGLVIMSLVLILAQSRAVIPILFLASLTLLVLLARRATLKPTMSFWVAVPLVVMALLLTQVVKHEYNPLYRRSLPLETRLKHLTAEHLQTETRLRILVCSMPVVAENFLLGTSFGSFHYVYPEVQGEYFLENPDTFIFPTDKKSFHAHNEYLQTLFETGGVGLGLGLTALFAILVGGWKTLESSFRQRHIAIELAIFVSMCALLVHGAVDFPFRVAPISCSLILLLALWSAGDRLWLIPVRPYESRPEGTKDDEELASTRSDFDGWKSPGSTNGTSGGIAPRILWGAVVLLLAYGITLGGAMGSHWFAGKVLTLRGSQLINRATTGSPQGMDFATLREADQVLKHATTLAPMSGEAYFHWGHARYARGTELARQRQTLLRSGAQQQSEEYRQAVLRSADESIYLTNRSLSEFRYHGTYRQRAGGNYLIFTHLPVEMREQAAPYLHTALEDLERSVLMNPGDPETINLLITWKQAYTRPTDEELRKLYFLIYNFHRPFFEERMVGNVTIQRSLFQFRDSYELARMLLAVNPDDPELKRQFVASAILAGEYDAARVVNDELSNLQDPLAPLHNAWISTLEGNPERALYYLAQPMPGASELERDHTAAMRFALRARIAEMEGNDAGAAENWSELRKLTQDDSLLAVSVAWMLNQIFDLPGRAQVYLDQKLKSSRWNPQPSDYMLQATIRVARHRAELEKLTTEQAAAAKRNEPLPVITDTDMAKAVAEAIQSYDNAFQVAATPTEKEIINRARTRLQKLLPAKTEETPSAP